uniref:Cadherin 15 n=1 Tax=Gallus gallus TaxID=9031 RepID=A0A8V0Y339_CHICK
MGGTAVVLGGAVGWGLRSPGPHGCTFPGAAGMGFWGHCGISHPDASAALGSPPGWQHHEGSRRVKRAWVIPPISISENHKRIPHLLVQIKSDKQQPGGVIYSIKGPGVDEEPLGIFSIDKFSGKVFLNATLDREQNDRFRLKAFALDLGGTTLEDPTDLEIIVVDQNDNRPLFRRDVFTGRVVEGAAPGTCVLTVEATDADDPETDNAALRYSILQQGHGDMFRINASTGEICTARDGLDREAVGVYNLTLQAADMSGDGLTTTATAVIYLEDVNDNAPEFTKEEFSMEVEEQAAGAEVGRVLVHDKDLAGSPNWAAKFTILEGDPEGAFAIHTDPHTNDGVLSVAKPLDHEVRDRFQLTVSVQNQRPLEAGAASSPRAVATVRVRVRDVNEAPVFRENPRRVSVLEGTPPGTAVTTYTASDPDTRRLQTLTYALLYDPAGWLQLDPRSGTVRTQRELRDPSAFLQGGWYIALLLARDDADPPLSATGTLSIEIVEVNDHAPQLQPPSGAVCGRPGRGGTLLLGASDRDRPPHGAPFHFQLSPQHPQLARNWSVTRFNVTHAVLAVLAELPAGPYSLPLLLRDSGTPPPGAAAAAQRLRVSLRPRRALRGRGPGGRQRRGRGRPGGPRGHRRQRRPPPDVGSAGGRSGPEPPPGAAPGITAALGGRRAGQRPQLRRAGRRRGGPGRVRSDAAAAPPASRPPPAA